MRWEVIDGGILPDTTIAFTHSEKKAAKVIEELDDRKSVEEWGEIRPRDATTSILHNVTTGGVRHLVWMTHALSMVHLAMLHCLLTRLLISHSTICAVLVRASRLRN